MSLSDTLSSLSDMCSETEQQFQQLRAATSLSASSLSSAYRPMAMTVIPSTTKHFNPIPNSKSQSQSHLPTYENKQNYNHLHAEEKEMIYSNMRPKTATINASADLKVEALTLVMSAMQNRLRSELESMYNNVERRCIELRRDVLAHLTNAIEESDARLQTSLTSALSDHHLMEIEFRQMIKNELFALRSEFDENIEREATRNQQWDRKCRANDASIHELKRTINERRLPVQPISSVAASYASHVDERVEWRTLRTECLQRCTQIAEEFIRFQREWENKGSRVELQLLEMRADLDQQAQNLKKSRPNGELTSALVSYDGFRSSAISSEIAAAIADLKLERATDRATDRHVFEKLWTDWKRDMEAKITTIQNEWESKFESSTSKFRFGSITDVAKTSSVEENPLKISIKETQGQVIELETKVGSLEKSLELIRVESASQAKEKSETNNTQVLQSESRLSFRIEEIAQDLDGNKKAYELQINMLNQEVSKLQAELHAERIATQQREIAWDNERRKYEQNQLSYQQSESAIQRTLSSLMKRIVDLEQRPAGIRDLLTNHSQSSTFDKNPNIKSSSSSLSNGHYDSTNTSNIPTKSLLTSSPVTSTSKFTENDSKGKEIDAILSSAATSSHTNLRTPSGQQQSQGHLDPNPLSNTKATGGTIYGRRGVSSILKKDDYSEDEFEQQQQSPLSINDQKESNERNKSSPPSDYTSKIAASGPKATISMKPTDLIASEHVASEFDDLDDFDLDVDIGDQDDVIL